MGLGKLNYSNRKSEGVKLGQIVAKDLRKRVGSLQSKDPLRRGFASLELCIDGRNLTDDGLYEAVKGLKDAIGNENGAPCFALEELNLACNTLTSKSLRALAPIIQLSASHLKDLDLSGNIIKVVEQDEIENWAVFLGSFRHCSALRRLVLSNSDLSGSMALETFTRIYCQSSLADLLGGSTAHSQASSGDSSPSEAGSPNGDALSRSVSTSLADKTNHTHRRSSSVVTESEVSTYDDAAKPQSFGLRSIPYVILSEARMDDVGALWLSYALEHHDNPDRLMTPIRPGPAATTLQEYREKTGCLGLVYLPNNSLTDTGLKVLKKAEKVRLELMDFDDEPDCVNDSVAITSLNSKHETQRKISRSVSAATSRSRRISITSRLQSAESNAADLDSWRKKIQRTTIEDLGHREVELWRAALKMISYSRMLMSREDGSFLSMKPLLTELPDRQGFPGLEIDGQHIDFDEAITADLRWTPREMVDDERLGMGDWISLQNMTSGASKLHMRKKYRVDENLGGLPGYLWCKILLDVADPNGVLDRKQQASTFVHGSNRRSLGIMAEAQRKGESHQIWHLLRITGCLTYEMRP